jgi:serine/threonine protein kinase
MEGNHLENLGIHEILEVFARGNKVAGEESEVIVKTFENFAVKLTKKQHNYQYDFLTNYRKINFPNVIKIYNVFELENCFYTKMEKLSEVSQGFKSYDEAFRFLKDCINGLSDLQKNEIAHNDIKNKNIMKTDDGVFKIIDLDYITVDKYDENDFKNSNSNIFTGTPGYYSPERLKQSELYNLGIECKINAYKSDVYSLGISFLNLLFFTFNGYCCNLPLDNQNIEDLINNLQEPYSNFREIITEMVNDNPDQRVDAIDLYYQFHEKFETCQKLSGSCFLCKSENTPENDLFILENRGVCCRDCIKIVHYQFKK